ncbi:MAG: hypothetical protein HYU80_00380 [Candidatus Blackburnbacteria bacterium]|nr:hypothetical protein [Candidatus Blackburnbacteria bacterium]
MNHKTAILLGVVIWAFTFTVAILVFPLRATERPLFESIMPVVLTLTTVAASYFYLKRVKKGFVMQGLCLGIIWLAINLLLDSLMFSWGPMKMSLSDYIKDIGVTYLIIFIIPLGFGYLLEFKENTP